MATTNGTCGRSAAPASQVFPLCLGGNVFGWTADEDESFAVLDAYVAAGGNFIDTGERLLALGPGPRRRRVRDASSATGSPPRGKRDDVIIATKLGSDGGPRRRRTSARAPRSRSSACRADFVDVMYAHYDDPETPLEESLARARRRSSREGKVRHLAASNFTAERLDGGAGRSAREGFATLRGAPAALQPARARATSRRSAPVAERHGLADGAVLRPRQRLPHRQVPRRGRKVDSPRAAQIGDYEQRPRLGRARRRRGHRRRRTACPPAPSALAWLAAQPTVVAPDRERPHHGAARRAPADGGAGAERRRAGAADGSGSVSGDDFVVACGQCVAARHIAELVDAMSRFAEPQDPVFRALNTSLGFDRRLWPHDVAPVARPRADAGRRRGSSATTTATRCSRALDAVEAELRGGPLPVRRRRRGHPHGGRAARHRARRPGRRQAAHRALAQRPGGDRRRALHARRGRHRGARDARSSRRTLVDVAERAPRLAAARLHAPPARAARLPRAPPARLRLDARSATARGCASPPSRPTCCRSAPARWPA